LDTIDATEIPAQRVALAGDEPATSSQDDRRRTPVIEDQREAQEEERARRVRRRRDILQQEIEIAAMEQQLDVLRRQRNAGYTPAAGSSGGEDAITEVGSNAGTAFSGQAPRRGPANRPRLREPDTFKGKTLKEARDFIRSLELVFALAPDTYSGDQEKVLYGVMFLVGEPRET
jgi:hypothetical protein